jgi:hypothetical protein
MNVSSSNESSFIIDSPKAVKEDTISSEDYILSLFEVGDLIAKDKDSFVEVDKLLSIEERL